MYDISLYINCVFVPVGSRGWIRTLVAMPTNIFHKIIMGRVEIDYFPVSMGIFGFCLTEMFIE